MIVLKIILALLLVCFVTIYALYFQALDRIGHAKMQRRVGPPLMQGFYDFFKLMGKENITSRHAVGWMFNWAPFVGLAATLLIFLYIPMGSIPAVLSGHGDAITVMYLITTASICTAMAAFASGSPIANIGAQREIVLMMSFEVPTAIVVGTVAWIISKAGVPSAPFDLNTYNAFPVWSMVGWIGFIGLVCFAISLLMVVPGESGTGIMDIAEAKTEILEGMTVEFSGMNLAIVNLSLALRSIAFSAFIVSIFFPGSLVPGAPVVLGYILDFFWFWIKVLVVALIGVTYLRSIFGRLKIWQASRFYWFYVGVLSFAGMILVTAEVALR